MRRADGRLRGCQLLRARPGHELVALSTSRLDGGLSLRTLRIQQCTIQPQEHLAGCDLLPFVSQHLHNAARYFGADIDLLCLDGARAFQANGRLSLLL